MADVSVASVEAADSVVLTEVGRDCYAATLTGHPTVGAIVGVDGIVLIDGGETPAVAAQVGEALRRITDKPVRKVVFTHYHADATLGAAAFDGVEILSSSLTRGLMSDRGRQNRELIANRRTAGGESVPFTAMRPVWPTVTFGSSLSLWSGEREIRVMHLGRGHTLGDVVVWVPDAGVMFAGDLVVSGALPDLADGYLRQWPVTLDRIAAFRPTAIVPGRGMPATSTLAVEELLGSTRQMLGAFVQATDDFYDDRTLSAVHQRARDGLANVAPDVGTSAAFDALLLVGASRALAEADGREQPDIWSVERERQAQDKLANLGPALPDLTMADLVAADLAAEMGDIVREEGDRQEG